MQRLRTELFSRPKTSGKPPKGSEEKFEQKPLSSSAEERRFALDSRKHEDNLCSTECPENAVPECLHSVTNQELVNVTVHQEQLQEMRLYKEDIDKCQDKVKQLVSRLALKEEAEKDLTAWMTQQQEDFEKARLTWLEDKKNVHDQATAMKSHLEYLHGKYTKLMAKANHDSNRVKLLSSALNAEQAKVKSLKEEHRKEIEALQEVKSSTEVIDPLRTEKLVSLCDEVSQISSLKNSLVEENQQLHQKMDDAENYSMKLLSKYCNSDKETLEEKPIVIGALQQLEKTNLAPMQRNTVLNDEKHQLELEKQQLQEDKDRMLQKLYTLEDNAKRMRDEYCGLTAKVSKFQSLTGRQKEEIKRLGVELKTSQTKEKLFSCEIKELTAKVAEISSVSKSRKKDLEYLRITVAKYKTKNEETLNSSLHVAECATSEIRRQMVILEELQTTKKSLHEDINRKAAEIASLLSQVEQTKAENEHLMLKVLEMKQNHKILMGKNEAMNANTTQLQSFEKQTEELRKELKKSQDKEKHLSGLTETLGAKVDELTSLLQAKDIEVDDVKTELQNSRISVSYLHHMIVNLTERVANFSIAKKTAEEKVHPLRALVKDTEKDKMKLATVIQDLKKANDFLKTNNAKLQSEVEGTLADNQSLLQGVRNLRNTEKQLAGRNTMINDQLTKQQSLDNVRNQNSELLRTSFQNCQASKKVLQEHNGDLEKKLKGESQKKRKSDLESQRRMFDSFAERSSRIQSEKLQHHQSDMSQDDFRSVTTLDSIEEKRAETCSEIRALEHTDVTLDDIVILDDITLNQDAVQSIRLSPREQALVNLIEMLNEQIEQRQFQDLTFHENTFDGETSDDQTMEYLQDISLEEQKEEQVLTITSEEKAKEPPKYNTFSMKLRMFFQVITFVWIFKWIKRQIRGTVSKAQHPRNSTNIDQVQGINLQQLTEGQFCLGLQLPEHLQQQYDEQTNERLSQFGLEQQTELCVQDSSVQLLECHSERRQITVLRVFWKLLMLSYYFFLSLSVLLFLNALKLMVDEP